MASEEAPFMLLLGSLPRYCIGSAATPQSRQSDRVRLREGNRLCPVTQHRARGSMQKFCFFFLLCKLQMEKDNNGDYMDYIYGLYIWIIYNHLRGFSSYYPPHTHALASCFADHSFPSTSHPLLILLQSRGPHSSSNPPASVLASGLLHLLFPLPETLFL